MKRNYKSRETAETSSGVGVVAVLFGILFFLILPMCNSNSDSHPKKTDGVFENATKKIDSGHADQLTKEEAQRLDDIINWCKICDKPLRNCKHGK